MERTVEATEGLASFDGFKTYAEMAKTHQNAFTLRKLGRFRIATEWYETRPDDVRRIMGLMLITSASTYGDDHVFIAYSDLFDVLDDKSEDRPWYAVEVDGDNVVAQREV